VDVYRPVMLRYSLAPMNKLSEWLDLMLGEIARKQDEAARAVAEEALRDAERRASQPQPPTEPRTH
jgi:hypothetical protein